MLSKYDSILNLPHPVSKKHPQMSIADRAAQFAPFAALTGYGAAIRETGRLTDAKAELDEYEKAVLNEKLTDIKARIESCPVMQFTYFVPDERKSGGAYLTITGSVKKVDEYEMQVVLTDGSKIPFEDIVAIEYPDREDGKDHEEG